MGEYRHTGTGEVKSQGQWRSHYSNVSLPRTWTAATLQGLNLEAVLAAPKPTAGQYETVARNGVTQDASGNWFTAWEVRDMFADTTDEDGVTTTKAEHETAYQTKLDDAAGEAVRTKRNQLLAETDYLALSDVTMSAEMTTYRQALRDIPSQAGFPDSVTWPEEPTS